MSEQDGYFDLQVNGYGGVNLHNPALSAEDLHRCCERLRADGNDAVLFTVITAQVDVIVATLKNFVALREKDELVRRMMPGVHIEGPFISPVDGYRGAHPRDAVRQTDAEAMKRMLDAAAGLTRLVTLAPEQDPGFAVTKLLSQQGIRVSGGHSNASMDELKGAVDAGLSMWTHLGNGCPMQMHRHENIIQRVLSQSDKIWTMFIADGAHVAFPALRNYLKAASPEKTIVVTDAITPAGQGPGIYRTKTWGDVMIEEDLVVRSPDKSHLLGSAMTMPEAVKRLISEVGLTQAQADQYTKVNPRRAIPIS